MRKKVLAITAVSVVIFIAVIAAALNAVFTVTRVEVVYDVFSSSGEAEALALQDELETQCVGKSTAFLDLDDVRQTVAGYPCFELVSCKKSLPQKLLLEVRERKETFAYLRGNGVYAMLDENGLYLYDNTENVSRTGGGNIFLEGFSLTLGGTGELAEGEYLNELLAIVNVFAQTLGNVRANVVSVSLLEHRIEGAYFRLQMQEGVYIDLYTPANNTEAKAQAALEAYLALSDSEKTYGYFDLLDYNDDSSQFTVSRHTS